jgi:large subunit ribosomal protein L9
MQVVLLANVDKLGRKGEICEVKEGYAKNFLFAKGLAVTISDPNAKKIREQLLFNEKQKKVEVETAQNLANRYEGKTLRMKVKVGNKGQLFSSISESQIKKAILQEFKIQPKKIIINSIKSLGNYQIELDLRKEES